MARHVYCTTFVSGFDMPWLSKFNVIVNTNLELQTLEVIIKYKIDVPNLVDEFNMSLSVSDL